MNLTAKQRASIITRMKPGDSLTPKARQDPSLPLLEIVVLDLYLPNPLNGAQWKHGEKSGVRKVVRETIKNKLASLRVPALPASFQLCRLGPRKLDRFDGLPASLKSVVDGIADAYGLPDHDPRFDWMAPIQEKSKVYGVRITITAREVHP